MNTIENNKLIAEFMGIKTTNGIVFQDANTNEFHTIKYHESWDWLMPVVEKINLLDDYRYTVYIASMDTRIEDNITGDVVVDIDCKHSIDELIRSVYEAVVEFINQYNIQEEIENNMFHDFDR